VDFGAVVGGAARTPGAAAGAGGDTVIVMVIVVGVFGGGLGGCTATVAQPSALTGPAASPFIGCTCQQ
jgi:hypothetical protein